MGTTMDDTSGTTNASGPGGGQDGGQGSAAEASTRRLRVSKPALAGKLPAVKLPALKLPALKLPKVAGPRWRRPRPGKPSLPDLVLSVGAASLVLSVLVVVTGPARQDLEGRARAATVLSNAATLQLAAESYAAANLGRYPDDVLELLPYLPAGDAPRNPYSGEKSRFRGVVGDVTYRPGAGGGYVIEAWGPGIGRPGRLGALKSRAPAATH
jgi:hypothetical protein